MEQKPAGDSDVLPLDRYIRAVAVCNSLALLASQGTMAQFIQRIAILTQLQKYWTKGYETISMSCAEAAANGDDDDNDDDGANDNDLSLEVTATPAPEMTDNWETHSNSTVDLKPDIGAIESEPEAEAEFEAEASDGDYEPTPAPRRRSKTEKRASTGKRKKSLKVYPCTECGETFRYRNVLLRHMSQKHNKSPTTIDSEDQKVKVKPDETTAGNTSEAENSAGDQATQDTADDSNKDVAAIAGVKRRMLMAQAAAAASRREQLRNAAASKAGARPKPSAAPPNSLTVSQWAIGLPKTTVQALIEQTHFVKSGPGGRYCCPKCNARFMFSGMLIKHMKTHGKDCPKPFNCSTCGMGFFDRHGLTIHLRKHTGERPYACSQCGKRFAQLGTCNVHEKTHNAVQPHVCSICGHQFVQAAYLRYHMRIHTGERPYTCATCGKSFRKTAQLRLHERVHSGDRPYLCTQCTAAFKTANALKRHSRMHAASSYCRCSVCDKGFTQLSNLRIHMRTHTGEKPYCCQHCGQRFSHSGSLRKHLETEHSDFSNSKDTTSFNP